MLPRVHPTQLNDFFTDLSKRPQKGVYFCRIGGYNEQIHAFILQYYQAARTRGVVIAGRLPNPDNQNIAYYNEIMGPAFQADLNFIQTRLAKWLPRMTPGQRDNVARSIYDTLMELRKAGKNDNILHNAYVKFMCWLYYRFERIVGLLGQESLPKIIYDGELGLYELLILRTLSTAGCDIVLLQLKGDASYLKLDPQSRWSSAWQQPGLQPFPQGYSLTAVGKEIQEAASRERLYGSAPKLSNCTNAWITGTILEDIRRDSRARGEDQSLFYNCFCRITGVEDKVTYANDLYQLQADLKAAGRKVLICSGSIPPPDNEEVRQIQRGTYKDLNQMLTGLSGNLRSFANETLRPIVTKAFVDLMLEAAKNAGPGDSLGRQTTRAVNLLCWIKRYQGKLFSGWKEGDVAAFLYLGGCRNDNEALFLRFLARLPVDVLILCPDLSKTCVLQDPLLYEVHYTSSLALAAYPEERSQMRGTTAAYQAERELDTILYQDSGIYRNQQYAKAEALTLETTYEEIAIYWDQELNYRPNFATDPQQVTMPVLFAKASGVAKGKVQDYWVGIKKLLTENTILVTQVPWADATEYNPMKPFATEFFRNGKLQRNKIKAHKAYPYGFLREAVQDHLLDKLQLLIDTGRIKGTFTNGTEYTIVSTVLNLDKNVLRLLQSFDFTKKNPKILFLNTGEAMYALEDAIRAAFLSLAGFDVLFFVPTGYQCIEQHFAKDPPAEHICGAFLYDLQVPDFSRISTQTSFLDRLFGRG